VGTYFFILDYWIRSKFESHRWNLPSRIYSDSFYLYPDQKKTVEEVERRLERLEYKRVAGPVKAVGEFSRLGASILSVYLHNFAYPSEEFLGFPITIEFSSTGLKRIQRMDDGEVLNTLKLEPELIASIFDQKMEDRTVISINEMPQALIDAVVAIEDERFYEHHGIDPLSILRAFLTDLLHLRAVQGGSTLTQQLIKNYFLSSEKTVARKINEMMMAILIELRYSKREILEAYFNEIYFGQKGPISITGIEEAARFYFSKKASQLSLAESALLAGVVRSPGEYSPYRNINRAYDRRNFVLKVMKEKKMITPSEYEKAHKEKIVLKSSHSRALQAPYFVDFVQSQLKTNYPEAILKSQGINIFTTLDMDLQEVAETKMTKRLGELEENKANLKKIKKSGNLLEGAFIALQPETGAIRAYVGGRAYELSQFDRVAEAHRQPGSSFKPFVYLTALAEEGKHYNLASMIDDTSFSVPMGGRNWTPENYDKSEHGTVTFREALEHSYNIATTKLAMEVGLEKVVMMAHEAGIESPLQPYPSLALGAFEVTPLELARAYTLFPNHGTRSEPIAIMSVVTREGQVLEKRGYKMQGVISPELAYLMNYLMRGVLDRGTASSARTLGYTGLGAGKTGTTSDYRDSWFVGYTPDLLALVWVGYDDGTPTGLSGASGALPLWVDFMKAVNPAGASHEDFLATQNILLVKVSKTGKLYRPSCGEPFEEAFLKGTEPHEYCDGGKLK